MTTSADWQKVNEGYLVAALAWLRLRLERLAENEPLVPLPAVVLPLKKTGKRQFFAVRWLREISGDPTDAELETNIAPTIVVKGAVGVSDEEVARAAAAMAAAEQSELPPALTILSQRFGLSAFEKQ